MPANAVTIQINATDSASAAFQNVANALRGLGNEGEKAGEKFKKKTEAMKENEKALSNLKKMAMGYLSLKVGQAIVQEMDAWTRMANQLKGVTRDSQDLQKTQDKLYKLAQDTRSPIEATTVLYSRLSRSTKDLHFNQGQLLTITKAISQGFQISGATANEAQNAVIQLSQGLGSGTLRGEELNSVMENASFLAMKMAEGMGVPYEQFKKLAAEGKLTSTAITEALLKTASSIDSEFAKTTGTVEQSITTMGNAWGRMLNSLNETFRITQGLSNLFIGIGNIIDTLSSKEFWGIIGDRSFGQNLRTLIGSGLASGALGGGFQQYGAEMLANIEAESAAKEKAGIGLMFAESSGGAQRFLRTRRLELQSVDAKRAADQAKEMIKAAEDQKKWMQSQLEGVGEYGAAYDLGALSDDQKSSLIRDNLSGFAEGFETLDDVVIDTEADISMFFQTMKPPPDLSTKWKQISYNIRQFFTAPGAGVFPAMSKGLKDFMASLGTVYDQVRNATVAGLQTFRSGLSKAFGDFLFGDESRENLDEAVDRLRMLQGEVPGLQLDVLGQFGEQAGAQREAWDAIFGAVLAEPLPNEAVQQINDLRAQMMGLFAQPNEENRQEFAAGIEETIASLTARQGIIDRFKDLGGDIVDAMKQGGQVFIVEALTGMVMKGLLGLGESILSGILKQKTTELGTNMGIDIATAGTSEVMDMFYGVSIGTPDVSAAHSALDTVRTKIAEIGSAIAKPFVATAKFLYEGFTGPIWDKLRDWGGTASKGFGAVWDGFSGVTDASWLKLKDWGGTASKTIEAVFQQGSGWAGDAWNFINSAGSITKTITAAIEFASDAASTIQNAFSAVGNIGQGIKTGLGSVVVQAFAAGQVASSIGSLFSSSGAIGMQIGAQLGALLGSVLPGVGTGIGTLIGTGIGAIMGKIMGLGDETQEARQQQLKLSETLTEIAARGGIGGFLSTYGATVSGGNIADIEFAGQNQQLVFDLLREQVQADEFTRLTRLQLGISRAAAEQLTTLVRGDELTVPLMDELRAALASVGIPIVGASGGLPSSPGTPSPTGPAPNPEPAPTPPPAPNPATAHVDLFTFGLGSGTWANTYAPGGAWNFATAIPAARTAIDRVNTYLAAGSRYSLDDAAIQSLLLAGGAGINVPLYQQGTPRVPGSPSQMVPAILHGGEAVLPAREAEAYRQGRSGGVTINLNVYGNGDSALVKLIKEKAMPAIIDGVDRAIRSKARWGAFEMDNRAVRTVLQ